MTARQIFATTVISLHFILANGTNEGGEGGGRGVGLAGGGGEGVVCTLNKQCLKYATTKKHWHC